jgi:hypothetical protein
MRSGRRVAVAVMVVLAGGLAAPAAAAARADPSWVIQATPNPAGARYILLSGVWCASAAACTAVGYYDNRSGVYVTLAEAWNGSRWKVRATPNPAGAKDSYLSGVSCTSATACTATGFYDNRSGVYVTLAERWNGTKWKIQSTPNPAGGGILYGVSCRSATACTAAGGYENSSEVAVTLAQAWNGSRWKIRATPNPAGATSGGLDAVSCTSARACTAAGDYNVNNSGADVMLAERWNGTRWAVRATPNPAGATSSILSGVSCTSATACTAAGDYVNKSDAEVTLAEAWNGSRWKIQATPVPAGAQHSYLSGVSCTPAGCTAVGNHEDSSGAEVTLAERRS